MNKPYRLIALCGEIGAGKSTAAEILVNRHMFTKVPLATQLKSMLQTLGVPAASLYGTQEEKERPLEAFCGKSGRELMQTLGSWGRQQDRDFWLKIWASEIKNFHRVVVDDVRYANEFDFVRSMGGIIVKVVRNSCVVSDAHESEREWRTQDFDFFLENNGTKADLQDQLSYVFQYLSGSNAVVAGASA